MKSKSQCCLSKVIKNSSNSWEGKDGKDRFDFCSKCGLPCYTIPIPIYLEHKLETRTIAEKPYICDRCGKNCASDTVHDGDYKWYGQSECCGAKVKAIATASDFDKEEAKDKYDLFFDY